MFTKNDVLVKRQSIFEMGRYAPQTHHRNRFKLELQKAEVNLLSERCTDKTMQVKQSLNYRDVLLCQDYQCPQQ